MEISNLENGPNEAEDDEDKPVVQSYSLTRAIICVILFNLVLACATLPLYYYLTTTFESVQARIVDFLVIGGATIAIPLLYRMGDLSKSKPNFYYI